MPKTNVMHILPSLTDCSIYRITRNIVTWLGHENYNWHVTAPNAGPVIPDLENVGATALGLTPEGVDGRRGAMMDTARSVREYIEKNNIHIIHTHNATATVIAWLASRGNNKVRHVYTKHLLTYRRDRERGWIYMPVDRMSMYLPDLVIPVSKTMGKAVLAHVGLGKNRVHPIQNAIDNDYFDEPDAREACRAEFNLTPENIAIGFTGRLEKMKRLDILLDSFAEVHQKAPHARLVIAGVGSLQESLEAQAKRLGISDAVVFAGWRSDIPRLLAAFDIYVQSSNNEGLSLSILEAMSAGKAVVATEVGGIHEVIQSSDTGLIIPPENQAALTKGLLHYVENPELLEKTGKAAWTFAREYFGLKRMMDSYDKVYQEQIAKLS